MKSRAIWFTEPHRAEVREIQVPDPGPDEVTVRCVANGICMGEVSLFRDVETDRWPLPRIVGHEGVGRVTKVGPGVTSHNEGDWVVCRQWAWDRNYAAHGLPVLAAPPKDPTAFLAEPVECVVGALRAYDLTPGDRVLVIGAGFMGQINVQGLAHCPLAELVVADLKPPNLELAESFGATEVINSGTDAGVARLESLREHPFDLVVECAGSAPALAVAQRHIRVGGRLAIFSWHHEPRTVSLGDWHVNGYTVLNAGPNISRDHNVDHLDRAVRLLEAGVFGLGPLITHRHSAIDVQHAMELALERPGDYIKGVLMFDDQ